jgi:hypothetical protein
VSGHSARDCADEITVKRRDYVGACAQIRRAATWRALGGENERSHVCAAPATNYAKLYISQILCWSQFTIQRDESRLEARASLNLNVSLEMESREESRLFMKNP